MSAHVLSDYDYVLPEELIAQEPVEPRDQSRLLIYNRATKEIHHTRFNRLADFLHPATRLVMNDSRVEQCRLLFDEGRSELFILEQDAEGGAVTALVRPGKRFRIGDRLMVSEGLEATVTHIHEDGRRVLNLKPGINHAAWNPYRHTPFPPYIKADENLAERYQTVYSNESGSKAAPTAGLHFTPRLLQNLLSQGFSTSFVTLHVGLGTFSPVKEEDISKHKMHSERYIVSKETLSDLAGAPHITAVGTTSLRVLESLADFRGVGRSSSPEPETNGKYISGDTDIFITPGYTFRHTDSLITNFHLPKSTLLMLVASMTGLEEMHRIYQVAIQEEYRFYSFGDAMLIL